MFTVLHFDLQIRITSSSIMTKWLDRSYFSRIFHCIRSNGLLYYAIVETWFKSKIRFLLTIHHHQTCSLQAESFASRSWFWGGREGGGGGGVGE